MTFSEIEHIFIYFIGKVITSLSIIYFPFISHQLEGIVVILSILTLLVISSHFICDSFMLSIAIKIFNFKHLNMSTFRHIKDVFMAFLFLSIHSFTCLNYTCDHKISFYFFTDYLTTVFQCYTYLL